MPGQKHDTWLKAHKKHDTWLKAHDLLAITTRVSQGDECSVIISDGQVEENV